jgi:hypothetical protein
MFRRAGGTMNAREGLTLLVAIVFTAALKIIAFATHSKWGIDMMACSFLLVFLVGIFVFPTMKVKDPFFEAEKKDLQRKLEAEKLIQKKEDDKLRRNILD